MSCIHSEGPKHDCLYVDMRNSLIPTAEGFANGQAGGWCQKNRNKWAVAFLAAMDKLISGRVKYGKPQQADGRAPGETDRSD